MKNCRGRATRVDISLPTHLEILVNVREDSVCHCWQCSAHENTTTTTDDIHSNINKNIHNNTHNNIDINNHSLFFNSQIVDPSIEGTKNVLSSLDKSSTIKRLVHTSSIAAIQSVDQADGTEFTETDWNTWSTIDNGDAYGYAKTQAERLVHDHVKQRPYGYAVVNPAVALGPCLTKAHTKASVVIIRQLLYGNEQGNWFGTYVDVRDVALAHVEALVRPEAQGQRFIAANPKASRWVVELEEPTQRLFPDYKVEGCAKPWYLIGIARFLTWFGMGLTPFQENMLDKKFTFNSATTTKVLGVEFRDIEESIKDSVESMVKPGWIKPRPNK